METKERQKDREDDKPKVRMSTMIGIGQIIAMLIGFGSVIYTLGVKGEQLDAARKEVERLAATLATVSEVQSASAVADATNRALIEEMRRRLEALERRVETLGAR